VTFEPPTGPTGPTVPAVPAQPATTTVPAAPTKGPRLRTSVITTLVGLGLMAIAGGGVSVMLFHRIFVTTYTVPGSIRVHLHEGTWNIYELSGGTDSYGPVSITRNHGRSIEPSMVTVDGPDGAVRVRPPGNESISRGGDSFGAAAQFEAPTDGTYRISIDAPARTRVMVAPSFVDILLDTLPWLIFGGVAGIVALAGFVMLIVGTTRRQRVRRAAWLASGSPRSGAPTLPALPPPGWHPDPYGDHRYRWWDGNRWTEQISD
jgi:hypothetical protein